MKKMNRNLITGITLTILLTIINVSLFAQFGGGNGTSGNPWQVGTATHLNNIRNYAEDYFIQTGDIDLSQIQNWVPIYGFTGLYDGDGYSISNLTIIRPDSDQQGLFSDIVRPSQFEPRPKVINLRLLSFNVIGRNLVGSLVGRSEDAIFESIIVSGNIEGSMKVGGIIGEAKMCDVEKSSAHIQIDCLPSGEDDFSIGIGGLIGHGSGSEVTQCYSTGLIQPKPNEDVEVYTVGGLVGLNERYIHGLVAESGNLLDSYSTVDVSGTGTVGGLAGHHNSVNCSIENCYATGSVIGDNDVGGLVGICTLYGLNDYISDSYWDIEASGQATSAGGVGLTTHEMLNYYSFDNWDFTMGGGGLGGTPIWGNWSTDNFNPYMLKTYPYLSWQGEPGDHNKPLDTDEHIKYFRNNRLVHWDSFPRLEEDDDWDDTIALLDTLLNSDTGIDEVRGYDTEMQYDYLEQIPAWDPDEGVSFNRWNGYQLEFQDPDPPFERHDWYLQVSGEKFDGTVTLSAGQDNWVGYWEYETQDLLDAISHIEENVDYIQGQDGGYYWSDFFQMWWGVSSGTPDFNNLYTFYGKMYNIRLRDNEPAIQNFTWSTTRSRPENIARIFDRQQPQYFSFKDKPRYEEFFIEEIENDEGLQEIGAFVGEECVGAVVFEGVYPVRLLAYTDESHLDREISFVLHRGNRSGEPERIRIVEARNNQTGEYSRQTLNPLQQRYTSIRLGAGDYTETVVTPQIVMGQNFPNPFVISANNNSGSQTRSESVIATNIPIYLSKDMNVDISVFNIKGQRVRTITTGNLTAGKHTFSWNGTNEQNQAVGAGIYFYKLKSEIETINKKMLLIR